MYFLGDFGKIGTLIVEIGDKKIRIEVGYGLEGAIPDATANQISDNELGPGLASGNYYEAIDKTVEPLLI